MQCSQKVGQKKWSHNSSQKTSRTSTPTPPLLKGLLSIEWSIACCSIWRSLVCRSTSFNKLCRSNAFPVILVPQNPVSVIIVKNRKKIINFVRPSPPWRGLSGRRGSGWRLESPPRGGDDRTKCFCLSMNL